MGKAGSGSPGNDGVDHDATRHACAPLVRRLLTLVGLTAGCWLIGMALHGATAAAAPSAGPDGAGRPVGVHDTITAVSSVVADTTEQLSSPVRTTDEVGHVAAVVRTAGRVTHVRALVVHTLTRTVPHTVGRTVAPVLTRVAGHRSHAAPRTPPTSSRSGVTTRHAAPAGIARSAPARPAVAPVRSEAAPVVRSAAPTSIPVPLGAAVAPISWPLDTVPSSPSVPQPLPFSPGGSPAAGGVVPSGHEIGATLPSSWAIDPSRGSRPPAPPAFVAAPGGERQPGFSPD